MNVEQTKSLTFYGRQELAMIPILLYVVLGGAIMIGFQYYSMKLLIFHRIILKSYHDRISVLFYESADLCGHRFHLYWLFVLP